MRSRFLYRHYYVSVHYHRVAHKHFSRVFDLFKFTESRRFAVLHNDVRTKLEHLLDGNTFYHTLFWIVPEISIDQR